MDNVRLYQQEHAVADTLQRSLLPELPEIPGHRVGRALRQRLTAADVGGDFYDLLHLPDGSIGIVVGDVVGHDVAAAAAMGHLRGRPARLPLGGRGRRPRHVLARVDRLVQGLRVASLATMVYARACGRPARATRGGCTWPTPATRRAAAGPRAGAVLDGVTGMLVGVDASTHRETAASSRCPPARR